MTQSKSSATTSSQIIHPLSFDTVCPDRSVLRESPARIACFDSFSTALEDSIREELGRIVVVVGELRGGMEYGSFPSHRQNQEKKG